MEPLRVLALAFLPARIFRLPDKPVAELPHTLYVLQ